MPKPENPFKGLQPYKTEDRGKLFGRDKDVILMKDRIFSARTTLLFAGSGVGKTSFINAKIIPELENQYSVFYHNSWAGGDKPLDSVKKTIAQQLSADAGEASSSSNGNGSALEFIQPLDQLLSQFRKTPERSFVPIKVGAQATTASDLQAVESTPAPTRAAKPQFNSCILILDQFEEVFQYHAYEDYFDDFLKALTEIINSDELQVRVVFSMREEFLGELSVFDNRIPDLFNNYYRLKYPDRYDAEEIISRTCALVGADVDEEKLSMLVRDLSKIEKGTASFSERAAGATISQKRFVERSFVIPPYLQIACQRLWEQQSSGAGDAKFVFLAEYVEDQAEEALRVYCNEKLASLNTTEKDLAARAFEFLVTKKGAKMAYELTSLADHMKVAQAQLKTTLEKLSAPATRILRETNAPNGSLWFELYHDIYGTIVDEWRQSYQQMRLWQKRLRNIGAVLLAGVLVFFFAIAFTRFVVTPLNWENEINTADAEKTQDYVNAMGAFSKMSQARGFQGRAATAWAGFLKRRALFQERQENREGAFLTWLQAMAMAPNEETADAYRREASRLLSTDYPLLLASFHQSAATTNALFSPDGKTVLTQSGRHVRLWKAETSEPLGDTVTLASDMVEDTTTRSAGDAKSGKGQTAASGWDASSSGNSVWDENEIPDIVAIGINAQTKTSLMIGVREEIIYLWNANTGHLSPDLEALRKEMPTVKSVAFSHDSRYLATGAVNKVAIWELNDEGRLQLKASFKHQGNARALAFSPDNRLLLTGDASDLDKNYKGQARVWNLDALIQFGVNTNATPAPLSMTAEESGSIVGVFFSPDGQRFVTQARTYPRNLYQRDEARVWDTATGQAVSAGLSFNRSNVLGLGADGKTVIIQPFFSNFDLEFWDSQTLAKEDSQPELALNSVKVLRADGKAALMIGNDGVTRLWKIEPPPPPATRGILRLPGYIMGAALSDDGKFIAAVGHDSSEAMTKDNWNTGALMRVWRSDTLEEVWSVEKNDPEFLNRQHVQRISLSHDGQLLAALFIAPDAGRASLHASAKPTMGLAPVRTLGVWNTGGQTPPLMVPLDAVHASSVLDPIFSSDGKYIAAIVGDDVQDEAFKIWDVTDASHPVAVIDTEGAIESPESINFTSAAFSTDGKVAIRGIGNSLTIWNIRTNSLSASLSSTTRFNSAAFSPDGTMLLAGNQDGMMHVWDVGAHAKLGDSLNHGSVVRFVAWSRDGRYAMLLTDDWVHLYSFSRTEKNALHYLASRFIGGASSLFSVLDEPLKTFPDGQTSGLRFIAPVRRDSLRLNDVRFDETPPAAPLTGNRDELLYLWKNKLGLELSLGSTVPKGQESDNNK